ncbi:MAG: sugar ABC transporter substrate-binding protein [Spirochaetales bacterium]|nr:sugar ABC transporter substrate-binding protein [Spirochaetales bacterium]
MKRILVIALLVLVALSFSAYAGGQQESAGQGEKQASETKDVAFIGLAAHAVRNSWEDLYVKAFNWYSEDIGIRTTWTEAGYDAAAQITQARRMIDMGIDGLIISPWDMEALSTVMEYAKENGVPVICTNTTVNHSYPLMFVGYGAERGARKLGERIVDYLEDKYGEPRGTILEVSAGLGTSEDTVRGGGFHLAVDKYENIEVVTKVANASREEAKTATLNTLRGGTNIDAVFAQNGSMGLGASAGLKEYDDSNPKDVYIATVDAFPDILEEIKAGNIDVGLDQPPAFYNPIAIHYMLKYLEEGESALPDYGDTITAEDLTIRTGKKHLNVDPWAEPIWAPAEIKHMTNYSEKITEDFRWFATDAVFVTEENADSELLWGNFPLPGWK